MWTKGYMGGFIHGYLDRGSCTAQFGGVTIERPSLRSAKVWINRQRNKDKVEPAISSRRFDREAKPPICSRCGKPYEPTQCGC